MIKMEFKQEQLAEPDAHSPAADEPEEEADHKVRRRWDARNKGSSTDAPVGQDSRLNATQLQQALIDQGCVIPDSGTPYNATDSKAQIPMGLLQAMSPMLTEISACCKSEQDQIETVYNRLKKMSYNPEDNTIMYKRT